MPYFILSIIDFWMKHFECSKLLMFYITKNFKRAFERCKNLIAYSFLSHIFSKTRFIKNQAKTEKTIFSFGAVKEKPVKRVNPVFYLMQNRVNRMMQIL